MNSSTVTPPGSSTPMGISPPPSGGASPASSPSPSVTRPVAIASNLLPVMQKQAIKTDFKFTTSDGVKATLWTLHEFIILLRRVIGGLSEDTPLFSLEEYNAFFAEKRNDDIENANKKRAGVETLATKHPDLLLDYSVYLRGILEELAKSQLEVHLKSIETMLMARIFPKTNSCSPTRTEVLPEQTHLPSALSEAWAKVGMLGELKSQLEGLKTKFAFINIECPDSKFAREYRKNEAYEFSLKFKQFSVDVPQSNSPMKDWQMKELKALNSTIRTVYADLKKEMQQTDFLSEQEIVDSNAKPNLSGRVTAISNEFRDSPLYKQVETCRKLYAAIQKWKEIVSTENTLEHLRQAEDRARLHQRIVHEITTLKAEVGKIDIGQTMVSIQSLFEWAQKASDDIKLKFESTKKVLLEFEKAIGTSKKEAVIISSQIL